MKSLSFVIGGLILILMSSSMILAQQWSDEQKEVWKTVETYNEIGSKGDVQGFLSCFDESYAGWSYIMDAPNDKSIVKKAVKYWFPNSKSLYYTLTPAKIWVSGDYAFVHYYYTQYTEDNDGKKEWEKGRWTDILMKKNGKWIIVGDHGGKTLK